jgi:hypothetical protein
MAEIDSLRAVIRYAGCAMGIAGAFGGLGLAASVFACLLLFYPES